MVENQTGRKVKVLRSNNRGKYTSKEFKDYIASKDIEQPAKYFRATRTERSSRAHKSDSYRECPQYQITG